MRIEKWPASIVLLVAAFAYSFPQVSARSELEAAAAAERAKQYSEAAQHYRKFLAIRPPPVAAAALLQVRLQLATDQFMAHGYQDSLESLRPLLESKPGQNGPGLLAQARIVAGLDELQLNRLPNAISDLRQGLQADPASGTARLALGDAYARSGRFSEAVDQYRDQTQRTPKLVEAWYKLGVAEAQLAKQTFHAFTAEHPEDPTMQKLAAERLLNSGDGLAAAKILLPLLPGNQKASGDEAERDGHQPSRIVPWIHADLGQAFLEEGYGDAAENEFRSELATDPGSAPAWFGMAEVESLNSHGDAATERVRHLMLFHPLALEHLLQLDPPAPLRSARQKAGLALPPSIARTPEGRLWQSWLQGKGVSGVRIESDKQDSCPALPEREASTPGLWLTHGCYQRLVGELSGRAGGERHLTTAERTKLAEAEFRLGHYEAAEANAARLLQQDPQSGWGAYWLTRAEEAVSVQALLQASSLNPNSARVHEMLARNDAAHYQWKQAAAEYEKAIRLAPNLADLYFGLGTAYWQAGDWTRAESALRKTLAASPASSVAAYELGDTFVNERRWADAVPCLRKSLANPQVEHRARLDLSKAESELGQPRQALADLMPVASDDPDGQIHFRLAALYRQMGDLVKARKALELSQKLRLASDAMTVKEAQQTQQERARLQQAAKQESH
jgi:tetratricopeptide (TPR) repeat protein